eukprot:SAG22_NODE_1_length_62449_cov_158.689270_17_plen_180_part_00
MTFSTARDKYYVMLSRSIPLDALPISGYGAPGDEQFDDISPDFFQYDTGAQIVLVGTEAAADRLVPDWKTRTAGVLTGSIQGAQSISSRVIIIPNIDFYVYPNPTDDAKRYIETGGALEDFDVELRAKQYFYTSRNAYKVTTEVYISVVDNNLPRRIRRAHNLLGISAIKQLPVHVKFR